MSLLDDVSIVVTPNGYKAGELYAVVPAASLGNNVIVNGDFTADRDWSKGTGWTISGGSANCDGSQTGATNLTPNVDNVTNNTVYKTTYTISNYVSGSIRIKLGNTGQGQYHSANGTYTEEIKALVTTFPRSQFNADVDFKGSIDNVLVEEVISADMDVTRATAATRVDEAGLVNYAEIIGSELVTNGDFSNGLNNWTVEGATSYASIVNGALNSNNTNAGNWYAEHIEQDISFVNGTTYKVTFKAKNISGNLNLRITQNATVIISENLTDSFVDYSVLYTANLTGGSIRLFCNSAVGQFEIDDISVKEITRNNVPRIDYTGGGCPHILAEPQRTNLVTYSEDFTSWDQIASITLTQNSITSPSGENDGTKFLSTGIGSKVRVNFSAVSGTTYTFSVYCKNIDATTVKLLGYDGVSSFSVDVTSEVNTSTWTKISLTFTAANTGSGQVQVARDLPDTESVYFWGAQLEVGSYPTSYIPTSGSTVTRNQDQFSRDGIGSLINSEEGVLFVEMAALVEVDTNRRFITLNDGGASNNVVLRYEATGVITARYQVGGVAQCSIAFATTITNSHKIAFKYKVNDFSLWIDGTEVGTDTSGSVLAADTINKISFDSGNGSFPFFGKVKQLQVYKTALTDAQLTSLTS